MRKLYALCTFKVHTLQLFNYIFGNSKEVIQLNFVPLRTTFIGTFSLSVKIIVCFYVSIVMLNSDFVSNELNFNMNNLFAKTFLP